MTVEENLDMGAFTVREGRKQALDDVYDRFPRLAERRSQIAGTLSGGEQQMLAMGRALMIRPKMMMLDEPSMGLAPILVSQIMDIVVELNKSGTTVLLVEQNARLALKISHRSYVVESGRIVLTDTAENLLNNEQVKRAYLGG
jgi:branched-chain amino acid transport system ATP-binding protein